MNQCLLFVFTEIKSVLIQSIIEESSTQSATKTTTVSSTAETSDATIPSDCLVWYDGCNQCHVENSRLTGMQRSMY